MFSVTSLGFLPFMALFVCLWYRVPQPSRWKLVLAANAVFCLSIDIGAFFAVALATAVVWQAAQHAQPEQPSRRGWLALGLAAALLPLLVLKYSGMLVPGLRDLYKPFGLAYYSLQLAGYLLDVWHGRTAPTPSYARLWCYAGFFLSLTQGPFNRYNTLMPSWKPPPKRLKPSVWSAVCSAVRGGISKSLPLRTVRPLWSAPPLRTRRPLTAVS